MEEFNKDNAQTDQLETAQPQSDGLFSEKSFAPEGQPTEYQQPVPMMPYEQPSQPQNLQHLQYVHQQYVPGYSSTVQDNQYRQMYSMQQPNTQPGGYYAPPPPPPPIVQSVSEIPEAPMKKSSKAWLVIMIIAVILIFAAVVLMLAFNHSDDGGESILSSGSTSSSGENVTVNIHVEPKPVEDESMYLNKETGLLTTAGAAQQALPSIVNIYGYTTTALAAYNEASGVIISDDGYIITNAHAVEDIKRIKVKLNDEREFEADVIGIDTRTDLAVLKIEADDIVPAVIGDSTALLQGEQIIAIGNAGGFNDTVTVGYVSHNNREIDSYTGYPISCIQTDAALNFGNSGGALVNMYGQVVGIVTSKYTSEGIENIGFAISSDFAVPIIEDLIENGYVSDRPRIGITYRLITPEYASSLEVKPGMLIDEIAPDCDVANTELQKDDIITEIDGVQILTDADIKNFQNTHKAGDMVTCKVYRKSITGEVTEFEITFRLEKDVASDNNK